MGVTLTPSTAYGCIDLLSTVAKQNLTPHQIAGVNFSPTPTAKIVEWAIFLNWIEIDSSGILAIAERGEFCLKADEPTAQLRLLLHDYFHRVREPWVQLARMGRNPVLLQAPVEISQLLYEAGLADGIDDDTIKFWDELALLLRGEKEGRQSKTGRYGERLTNNYEEIRTGHSPKWVALESNHYGYDVLSRVSKFDSTPLKIEVKCSISSISNASFFVTKFEWETAKRSNIYQFHLWSIAKNAHYLAVLPVSEIKPHIPVNRNQGSWVDVEIPFSIFHTHFSVINFV